MGSKKEDLALAINSNVEEKENKLQMVTVEPDTPSTRELNIKDILFRWTIKRISDIDTTKQRFYVEFVLKLIWKPDHDEIEHCKAGLSLSPKELFDWEPNWTPQISFPNALEVELSPINIGRSPFYQITKLPDNNYMITYDMEVRAWFMENFELESYPFDCQNLTIILKLGNKGGINKYRLVPDIVEDGKTFGKIDLLYSVLTEWRQHPSVLGIGFTSPNASKHGNSYPIVYCRLKVERRYEYYIKRMCIILALLSLTSLCAFGIDAADLRDRLALQVTLELSIVAFQFTIIQSLPVVSFLTFIDIYFLMAFIYTFSLAIEHVIVSLISDDDSRNTIDLILLIIFAGLWIVTHVIILFYMPILIKKEKLKIRPDYDTLALKLNSPSESVKEGNNIAAHLFMSNDELLNKIKNQQWAVFVGNEVIS